MLRYFSVNTVVELVCFLIGVICFSKLHDRIWKGFVLFLLLTVFAEMAGIHIKKVCHQPNAWLYNLLMLFQALFLLGMFKNLLYRDKRAPLIVAGALLFGVIYTIEWVYNRYYNSEQYAQFFFNNHAYTALSITVVLYSLYYFYRLLKSDEYVSLGRSAGFWWVAAALFFFFGATVCNLFYAASAKNAISTYYIYNVLNLFLYSGWSYAFICKRWEHPNLKN